MDGALGSCGATVMATVVGSGGNVDGVDETWVQSGSKVEDNVTRRERESVWCGVCVCGGWRGDENMHSMCHVQLRRGKNV